MQRRFLIATPDKAIFDTISFEMLRSQQKSEISHAKDGAEAAFKLTNVSHTVAFLTMDLQKRNGPQLMKWLLDEKKTDHVAIVLIGKIPDQEMFVDEVVSGRLQFLEDPMDKKAIERCLMKALTFYFHGDNHQFNLRFLANGETLMKEGDKADNCYLLRTGQLKAVRVVNGKEILLGFVEHGEFVGEMAYINHEPRVADVVAEKASELIEIPFERLDHVLFRKPLWGKALLRTLSKRLKDANNFRAEEN
jgi:ActR/RegA family two-component response regulator